MLLLLTAGIMPAQAQTIVAPPEAPTALNAIDFNFVGQANLDAPFQVDSGRIAERKGTTAAIRTYAHLMATIHIPVVDTLNVILRTKNITPSNTLLMALTTKCLRSSKQIRVRHSTAPMSTVRSNIRRATRRCSRRGLRT
jgi:predicted outer membrane protein